jgi:hypothetical protein
VSWSQVNTRLQCRDAAAAAAAAASDACSKQHLDCQQTTFGICGTQSAYLTGAACNDMLPAVSHASPCMQLLPVDLSKFAALQVYDDCAALEKEASHSNSSDQCQAHCSAGGSDNFSRW